MQRSFSSLFDWWALICWTDNECLLLTRIQGRQAKSTKYNNNNNNNNNYYYYYCTITLLILYKHGQIDFNRQKNKSNSKKRTQQVYIKTTYHCSDGAPYIPYRTWVYIALQRSRLVKIAEYKCWIPHACCGKSIHTYGLLLTSNRQIGRTTQFGQSHYPDILYNIIYYIALYNVISHYKIFYHIM